MNKSLFMIYVGVVLGMIWISAIRSLFYQHELVELNRDTNNKISGIYNRMEWLDIVWIQEVE